MPTLYDLHRRIGAVQRDATARPITIVFLGDSNTRGSSIDPGTHRRGYVDRTLDDLRDYYAPATFVGINAGIPGDTLAGGQARVASDVLRYAPDLVVVAFGLNDAVVGGTAGVAAFRATLQSLLTTLAEQAAVVVLTPSMMATADNTFVPAQFTQFLQPCIDAQLDGTLDAYVQTMRDVCAQCAIPLADAYHLWQSFTRLHSVNALLVNGINHPHGFMHNLAATVLMATLTAPPQQT